MFKLKISNKPIKTFYNIDLEFHQLLGTQLKKSNRILHNIFEYSKINDEFLDNNQPTTEYYEWRKNGMELSEPSHNSSFLYFLEGEETINLEPLSEIEARKKIYFKEYKSILNNKHKALLKDFTKAFSTQNVCIIDLKAEKQILVSLESLKTILENPKSTFDIPIDGMCLALILMGWTCKDLYTTAPEQKPMWKNTSLLKYVQKHHIKGWEHVFDETILSISKYLENKTTNIFPSLINVFKVFELLKLENIKIGILGQDPYIKPDQAMGIAFSVPKNVKIPPSLINIFNELIMEGYVEYSKHSGDLTDWVKKGIFLYNVCLTVDENKSGSHGDIWNKFSISVIKTIDEFQKDKMVWILLGNNAQAYKKYIKYGKILETSHPSPLSARRGFLGSGIFKQAADYLKEHKIMDKDIWKS